MFVLDGKMYQEKVQSMMYLRHSNSGGKSACSSVISLSPTVFTEMSSEGNITAVHLHTVWTSAASLNPLAADLNQNILELILTHYSQENSLSGCILHSFEMHDL